MSKKIDNSSKNKSERHEGIFVFTGTSGVGGAERVATDVYNNLPTCLKKRVTIYEDGEDTGYSTPDLTLGFKHSPRVPEYLTYIWKLPVGIIKYSRYLNKYHPNISWSLTDPDNIINMMACTITKTKYITSIRGNPESDYLPAYLKWVNYIIITISKRYAYKINTNSFEIKEVLISKYGINPEKISVIYNPKDIESIRELSQETVSEDIFSTEQPVLITAGRLSFEKGQWHLIRVFSELRKVIPAKLVICGFGHIEQKLRNLVRELEIEDDVIFMGWCANPYKYMKNSSVFVLPSLSELQPNVLIEAMVCGVPVVSADCNYGPREVLDGGKYGVLSLTLDGGQFNSTEPLSLAEEDLLQKIKEMLEDAGMRQKYARLSLERGEIFNKDKIMNEFFNMLDVNKPNTP